MPIEQSTPSLAEQLSQARAKIEELEVEIAQLRRGPSAADSSSLPPSFILESITDAFAAVDREFRYVWVNAEAERLLRMPRDRVLGRTIWELLPGTEETDLGENLRKSLTQQIPIAFESYYPLWNRWFFNRSYPTKEGGLSLYWREISGEKRAMADLRRQAMVLEQVHDAIVVTDLEGTITHSNRGAEKIFGHAAEAMEGRHISLLLFEEDRPQVAAVLIEPLLRDGQREIELRCLRKSREECLVRLSLSLLRDEADKPYGILGVATDITGQRRAEAALRESEARYHSLADAMPQVAYITDAHGQTQMVNHHWEEYSGYRSEECLNLDWLDWIHPDDAPGVMARWMECVPTGELFDMEYRLRHATGQYRWQLSRAVPVRNANGSIEQWVGTLTDIHDRKVAEEELRKSEERFRLASKAVEGIVYDWYPQTGTVHRLGSLERLIGETVSDAEPTDQWWQDRIHPDDQAKSTLRLTSSLRPEQNSFETEFRIRHADGHWVDVCDRGYIVRDEKGEPVRVVGSTYDISERKRLEREIQENNKRLKFQADILANTSEAVVAFDESMIVSYCNPSAERIYGVRSLECIGKPLSALFVNLWLDPNDEERARLQLTDHGTWMGESIHRRNDGTQIAVSSVVNLLPMELGGGLVAVIRDISERKRAELEIQRHVAELARANEDLLHFAYAVSHDLQAPLRTITNFSQLLALRYRTKLDEQGGKFVKLVSDASTRMSAMIRDLLEFAKVAGREMHLRDAVPLEEVLAVAIESLTCEIAETGAIITYHSLPTVPGDSGQFAQLFQNLIGNSLKYRHPDRTLKIDISAEQNEREWVITVRDNGIGFEPKQAVRIFRVFQRLHTTEFAGTGVGLAICKRIVERLGGRIWATGEPNEGAAFHFSIPINRDDSLVAFETLHIEHVELPADPQISGRHFDESFDMVDLAPAIVRGLDGTISIWTQGSERLFGWPENEAVGRRAHDLLETELPKPSSEIEAELLRNGEWSGELKRKKRDGSTLWVATHWALYRDGSGRPRSVIEVNSDITALKHAEAALLRSAELRDLALSAGDMGIWQWNCRTGKVEWSETIERFLGMPGGSFGGTYEAFLQTIHPEDRLHVQERIAQALKHGGGYEVEFRSRRGDGSYCRLCGKGQVTFDDHGEPSGLIGVVWDITPRETAV